MLHFIELIIGPVTAVSLSLFVNRLFEIRNKIPLLSFLIDYVSNTNPEPQDISTNPSGHQVVCYNNSQVPVYIQYIEIIRIFHQKELFIELFPDPNVSVKPVLPYNSIFF